MKKLSTLFVACALAFTVAACGKKDEKKAEPAPAAKPTEPAMKPAEPAAKPAEPAPTPTATAGSGIAECDEFKGAMEKYMACDKVPQAARDAQKQGFEQMSAAWAQMANAPAEAKAAAASGCKTSLDALKQGATAMGCTL